MAADDAVSYGLRGILSGIELRGLGSNLGLGCLGVLGEFAAVLLLDSPKTTAQC